jgi:anaerobic ribonucleoside-triphosphate reductase
MSKKQLKSSIKRTPCEVYSRIVGYIRPVQNWNPGKVEEFSDRKTYNKTISNLCSCD